MSGRVPSTRVPPYPAGKQAEEIGQPDRAGQLVREAMSCARRTGSNLAIGGGHIAAGVLARRRGQLDLAGQHLHAALTELDGTQAVLSLVWARTELAHATCADGDHKRAAAYATAALELADRVGDPRATALALEALARSVVESQPLHAAELLAAAAAMRARTSIPTPPHEQRDIDHTTHAACKRIGEELFEEAWRHAYERGEPAELLRGSPPRRR